MCGVSSEIGRHKGRNCTVGENFSALRSLHYETLAMKSTKTAVEIFIFVSLVSSTEGTPIRPSTPICASAGVTPIRTRRLAIASFASG